MLTRRALAASIAAAGLLPAIAQAKAPGPRVQFWATRTGGKTFDASDGGGNPFATALIEAIGDSTRDFAGVCAAVGQRTAALTNGRQVVETPGLSQAPAWRFHPAGRERRVALIVVFYDYTALEWAPLPGARNDGDRIERAFAGAGFETRLVANAPRNALTQELKGFARRAAQADVAAIYCTGHGMEWRGAQYVMPCDHHFYPDGVASLSRAYRWDDIAAAARARKLNLTMWAGCREYPPT